LKLLLLLSLPFIFRSFSDAVPTGEEEIRIYQEVAQVLNKSATIIEKLKTYTTRFKCEEAIRKVRHRTAHSSTATTTKYYLHIHTIV
jgi:hypothetical protein